MTLKFKVRIRKHEVGLWFRQGDLKAVLEPGVHWLIGRFTPWSDRIEVFDAVATRFEHRRLEVLVKEPALTEKLTVVDLGDKERALVWRDNRLTWVLGPGRYAFWKQPAALKVETFNVEALRLEHDRLETVLQHPDAAKWLEGLTVEEHEEVLVFRNGRLTQRLREGRYVYWKGAGRVTHQSVDLREQTADVAGQEIMTADKVSLRVNLVATYQVTDALAAVQVVDDYGQALYREAQLALRAAVGGRTLDALLADKESVGAEVRQALARRAAEFGVAVRSVGLKDIILPGDMKTILNQVIAAEKQAQANLIKRREEVAAARSQLNTAKLLAENPILARVKELELLQEILAGTKTTFVFGEGDIARRVRGLVAAEPSAPQV